jgi:hypothetical protein
MMKIIINYDKRGIIDNNKRLCSHYGFVISYNNKYWMYLYISFILTRIKQKC